MSRKYVDESVDESYDGETMSHGISYFKGDDTFPSRKHLMPKELVLSNDLQIYTWKDFQIKNSHRNVRARYSIKIGQTKFFKDGRIKNSPI